MNQMIWQGQEIFLFTKMSRLALTPFYYSMGNEAFLPWGKAARAWVWPFSAEVKNGCSYTSMCPVCLHAWLGPTLPFQL